MNLPTHLTPQRIVRGGLRRARSLLVSSYFRVPLEWRNRFSKAPVVSGAGPVVSLTSFGQRTKICHLAIESIGRGDVLPGRIILWIDDPAVYQRPPKPLRRLAARGLEIRKSEDFGPHKKYFPYLEEYGPDFEAALITADDDTYYPRRWLRELLEYFSPAERTVVAHRARRLILDESGFAPYRTWQLNALPEPSILNFATGVGGILYPPEFLSEAYRRGRAFQDSCPRADDIWLHHTAVRSGFRVRALKNGDAAFPQVFGTLKTGLAASNVGAENKNDVQLRATYDEETIEELRREAARIGDGPKREDR